MFQRYGLLWAWVVLPMKGKTFSLWAFENMLL